MTKYEKLRIGSELALFTLTSVFVVALIVLSLQISATVQHLRSGYDETMANVNQQVHTIGTAVSAECPVALAYGQHPAPCPGLLPEARNVLTSLQAVVSNAYAIENGATKTFALVNRPCDPAPCGTLADLNSTLATARGTMGQVEVAAIHENRNLGKLDGQEDQLFADVHHSLNDADEDIAAAHDIFANPAIPVILANAGTSSTSLDHMLATTDQVETKAAHSYLHPSTNPFVRTWQVAWPFFVPAAQIAGVIAR